MLKRTFKISVLRPGTEEKYEELSSFPAAVSIWGIEIGLRKTSAGFELRASGSGEAVLTFWCNPDCPDLFPLIPGFMIGHNRPEDTGPGYPQMTGKSDIDPPILRSGHWGIRADRASVPAAMIFGGEGMAAIAVAPYIESGNSLTVNGLRVCMKRGIGVSIGTIVEPVQFVHNGQAAPGYRLWHRFAGELKTEIDFWESDSCDRRTHSVVIRDLYSRNREDAPMGESVQKTVALLADALINDNLRVSQNEHFEKTAGEFIKIKDGRFGRSLDEIGWTGGSMLAYPLLQLQRRIERPVLRDYATRRLDSICENINERSGFFHDCKHAWGSDSKGWWCYLSPEAHYAYTQGHATYYLLKSASLLGYSSSSKWIISAKRILDLVLEQQDSGGLFPSSNSVHDGSPLSYKGFAGCWYAAALSEYFSLTGERKYFEAAVRAIEAYHKQIATLSACGSPMDTHDAMDQEGNLALLHAAARLHSISGDGRTMEILRDSADFEMLWRYYYNVKAAFPPLDTAKWGSSGGSLTSAHNPHIHPMHLNSLDQILYLYEKTGDEYYRMRTEDAVRYGTCCVCREDENFGWGKPGWLGERFCPSDGLLTQAHPETGEPWAVNCEYHPWTVAVTLEGFTGKVWDISGEKGFLT